MNFGLGRSPYQTRAKSGAREANTHAVIKAPHLAHGQLKIQPAPKSTIEALKQTREQRRQDARAEFERRALQGTKSPRPAP